MFKGEVEWETRSAKYKAGFEGEENLPPLIIVSRGGRVSSPSNPSLMYFMLPVFQSLSPLNATQATKPMEQVKISSAIGQTINFTLLVSSS